MESLSTSRIVTALAFLTMWTATARAQVSPVPLPAGPAPNYLPQGPRPQFCVKPMPMVRLQDYQGPFAKTVGVFVGPLERKSAHAPNYKPGDILCSLTPKQKFVLFLRDSYDPATFVGVAFGAVIDQAENGDPSFGRGASGYGKRFAAGYADQASFRFFKDFAYPSLFSEDPRYYRLSHGSGETRFLHAVMHVFVAHQDNGRRMFNASEWLGTTSAVVLSNLYHPDNRRGFAPAAEGVGISVGSDIGFDVLREFWPEISHKLKLPFREEPAGGDLDSVPGVK